MHNGHPTEHDPVSSFNAIASNIIHTGLNRIESGNTDDQKHAGLPPAKPMMSTKAARIYERAMWRWNTDHTEAERYLRSAAMCLSPLQCETMFEHLPPQLVDTFRDWLATKATKAAKRAWKRQLRNDPDARKEREEQAKRIREAAAAQWQEKESSRLAALCAEKDALFDGDRLLFLARLMASDRNKIATESERHATIQLRKACIWPSKTMELLGCTEKELNRWDADGRLPHRFKRPLYRHRLFLARVWHINDVANAASKVSEWRQQDAMKQAQRRR
ncbi:hypothetical protein [Acidiphilium sp. C61]|jgi:hypothetical protein|uniref:hypothetical protein n=1 Tax=Acidiphilium sp. C61 TaxID=1671485 RepID=UPI00157A4FA1|nr:hypothetical protein [Acidiphilium sp. C61]